MGCSMMCDSCNACKREETFIKFRDTHKQITEFNYNEEIHSHPTSILLGLTNRCNLNCTYCFVHQNSLDMTLETAKKSVEFAIQNGILRDLKPFVGFFGGEPLLKFEEIIVPLVEEYADRVEFGITTNGVLLNEDIVDFFYKYNIQPLLSFDGIPVVQNSQRPMGDKGSFDVILKNIPYLLLRFPNVVMRSTVTKNSIPFIAETVNMASEMGFKKITFCPNAYEDWDKETELKLQEQFHKIGLEVYKKLFIDSIEFPIIVDPLVNRVQLIEKATEGAVKFNNEIMRCGLGTTTCAITPNGDIVPCQEKISNPTYILGHIDNGINSDKHKEFLNWYFNQINNIKCDKGCSEKERLLCLSDTCPSRLEDLNFKFSTANCAFMRASIRVASRLHYLCANSANDNVRTYFNEGSVGNDQSC